MFMTRGWISLISIPGSYHRAYHTYLIILKLKELDCLIYCDVRRVVSLRGGHKIIIQLLFDDLRAGVSLFVFEGGTTRIKSQVVEVSVE